MLSLLYSARLKQLVVGLVCCLSLAASMTSVATVSALEVDFDSQIKPIFAAHCLSCHDEENEEGGFIIDRETTLDYVIAGDADESDFFMHLVTDDEDQLMPPPDDENPLSQQQISLVKTWINEGANWPQDVQIEDTDDDAADDADADQDTDQLVADPVNAVQAGDDADQDEAEPAIQITQQQLENATGSLHPAAVHLPIGLLLASGLFAFLSLRGNFVMSDCAYYCLWIGALGSIAASLTGWFYSPMEHQGDVAQLADLWDTTQKVFLHRTWALGCSVAALVLALMAMSTRARDPDDGTLWKLGVIVLAGAIGWVGHLGGELTYGKGHYKDLNAVVGAVVPAVKDLVAGDDADVEEEDEATRELEDDSADLDESASDESSSADEDSNDDDDISDDEANLLELDAT